MGREGRVVYVHIGAPKTGTTYLQHRLALNRRELARHGIHLPTRSPFVSPGLFAFRAALDLLGEDWGGAPGHAEGYWDTMVKRVRRTSGTAIISHEILAPAPAPYIAKLMADLAGREIHVVYSARDLARQAPAGWQESVKQGRKWSYRRYLNRVQAGTPWFARAFDLPTVLGRWGAGLPPERIHVVTVPTSEASRAEPDLLWRRFCRAFGIDPAWAPQDSDRANSSLGVAETQVLRRLNKRMDRATRREAEYDELIRGLLAEDQLVQRRSAPLTLPPRLHDWAAERGRAWVDWLKESGVDVVGELDDLLPAPLDPEQQYRNPDLVPAKAQLDAALDALTAMTREAAARTDPDSTLLGRARRVRELRGR
jgi:hypothetical protein